MAEAKKNTIVMACSVIGCIVTLITCGTLIGNMQSEVHHLKQRSTVTIEKLEALEKTQSAMKEKQAFLEGVVSTQLKNIQASVAKIEKRVDSWEVAHE